ncbi:phospholipid scramblase 2-like [Tropilaelaps mercedesae]|uniref:Phospholipid scramblase n=1 Tax=Tropilaelaps mercedesae TaxID=418985 RepID=A0A1V9XTR0_9ACAR|nr:phospholipid scramblase 2-like [Tropilaelaps mercedesae]
MSYNQYGTGPSYPSPGAPPPENAPPYPMPGGAGPGYPAHGAPAPITAPPYPTPEGPLAMPYPQPPGNLPPAAYPPYQQPAPISYPPPDGVHYPPPTHGGYAPVPVVQQPGPMAPGIMPGVPPGLEYLTAVDQLVIKQKVEMLEAVIDFETNNKYSIKNSMGQKVYQASEKNDCCTRMLCGPIRCFDMKIKDLQGNEVMHLYRPLRCTSCCFPCCLQEMEVQAPPGTVIGYVKQEWSIFFPKFTVRDSQDNVIFRIEGPFCTVSICGDVEFQVISEQTGQNVGKISKQWTGLLREAFTDADNFGISFPLDLHVHVKASMLAAAFLIDFMYFEKSSDRRNHSIIND